MKLVALLALAAAALAAGPARADDKCLQGASTLGDQRALLALRDACTCGSTARKAYLHCVRQAATAAVADATLRGACRSTAIKDAKTSSCGSARVACGQVSAAKIGCAVRPANACRDTRRTDTTACDATVTHFCRDVVDWTAGTCDDPRQPGRFGVGVRQITFTRQSTVDPAQARPLTTFIWYPTTPGAGPVDASSGGVVDAPVETTDAPHPLVMFSHGSCGYPAQSRFLVTILASRGFIVVAPPHPGNTIFEFPACGSSANQTASFLERPNDIRFVLDQMLGLNGDAASPFHGAVDASRLGMMGHSFGGLTTYLAATTDARYRVAVPLAPAILDVMHPVFTMPSLTMVSAGDTVVDVFRANTDAAFAAAATPKYFVELASTGHFAYSDGCFPGPDCNPPVTLTQDEAHAEVLRWVVPFLERYLAGTPGKEPFFAEPAPIGATLTAEP